MQPVTQSTNEVPQGPLLLRVYPGADCRGSLYQDDGKTLAYKRGGFLRMQFSCESAGGTVKLRIGPHEGNYHPWWNELKVEIYGQDSSASYTATVGKADLGTPVFDVAHHMVSVTVPDDGRGADVQISVQP
jgi:alpha-glucosidase